MKKIKRCFKCKTRLTEKSAMPSVLRNGRGLCNICNNKRSLNQRRINPREQMMYRARMNAKHRGVECFLKIENVPEIPKRCPVFPWIKLQIEVGNGHGPKIDSSPSL